MAVSPQAQAQWAARMAADPEFQRLYAAYKTGDARASYDFNKYLTQVLPKGMAWDGSQGIGLKDRSASPWTMPLAAAAGVATMGLGAGGVLGGLFGGGSAAAPSAAANIPVGAAGQIGAAGAGNMSILGSLGKGALGVLGGGSSGNKWVDLALGAAGKIGGVAGDAAAGRAEGRALEDQALVQRDRLGMDSASRNIAGDSARMRQLALIDLMTKSQDAQITPPAHIAERMPQMVGGLRPSAMQGLGGDLAGMRARILESVLSGQHMPELSEMPEAGAWDKVLAGLGTGGALLGSLGTGKKAGTTGLAPSMPNGIVNAKPLDIRNIGRGAVNPFDPQYGGATIQPVR